LDQFFYYGVIFITLKEAIPTAATSDGLAIIADSSKLRSVKLERDVLTEAGFEAIQKIREEASGARMARLASTSAGEIRMNPTPDRRVERASS
jgi:hypothetical protein